MEFLHSRLVFSRMSGGMDEEEKEWKDGVKRNWHFALLSVDFSLCSTFGRKKPKAKR